MFGKRGSKKSPSVARDASKQGNLASFRAKFANFSLDPDTVFKKKRPPPAPRSVYFNEPLPEQAFDAKGRPQYPFVFASNQVLTAKYTIYNFFFKNLLEQFRRVANLFFLLIVILQFFPQFTTINPGVSMLPLLAVLGITMIKDGYEDFKRHQSDRNINRLRVKTLTGGGWQNPNVMEANGRSLAAWLTSIRDKFFGGKKKQSSHLQKEMAEKAEAAAEEGHAHQIASPIPPAADAPGGGGATQVHSSVPVPGEANLPVRASHQLARRTTTRHSQFESEYEQLEDGRIMHGGRILNADEEHAFYSKKAPRWKPKTWENLAVGDFVYLTNNDPIPADIIICATSEEEDACFIETKNLDGETNLKARHAVPELTSLRTPEDCARASLRIDAEPQDTNMYRLNASVVLNDRFDKNGNPLQCPVTLNQILLRGCNVRNTKWVIGVVIMTGWDTKIIANSGVTPSKRSMIEKQMNPMVYFNLVILACVSVACAIADSQLEQYYFDRDAYWEYAAIYSDDNPRINGLVAFANSLITFQNIVPISLYISFEFVRLAQAYFIYDDYDIWYEKTNRRTTAKSWNLSDDLGQIEYIFSDKTGTLTQNVMIFRECAVAGVIYHGDAASPQVGASDTTTTDVPTAKNSDKDDGSTNDGSGIKGSESYHATNTKVNVKPLNPDIPPFHDHRLAEALRDADSQHAKQLGNFFRCLALCHTVLVEDLEDGSIEYQAQSPDEQALVQAAADAGFIFIGKERQTLRILTPYSKEPEVYELLVVNEFSSARKRMSVIVRRESDGQLLMLAKGADSIMFERARQGQEELKQETDAALEEFANKGLRTLCLGGKELTAHFYEDWQHRFHQASVSIQDREDKMEELASELEKDFDLYGATAIEDKLQDGVPETIADLKRAGINVWVATGDKLETAIAIGYSTMLLTEDMNLVVVRGGEYGQPNSAYEQLRKAVVRFFGGPAVLQEMEHQPPGGESESRRSSFMSRRPSYNRNRRSSVSQVSLVGEDNGQRTGGFALVIDGTALGHALSEEFSKDLLLRISTQCKAVICCRVSPLQKALIVRLIKDGLGVMTLAIGDGANDVSMIQAAHVGVGIAGEEGLQAVNSSDYAIAQFRYLKRLVLVHGHWSYYRNSVMITNFFYKQFIQVGTLFWFQIYCAWSTTQAIDYVYILLWNAVWTVAAVIFLGIFDRNINDKVLMQVPELYHQARKRAYFGLKPFLIYFFDGIYQSVVLFFFFAYSYNTTTPRNDGYDINLYEWTTGMAIASVLVANLFVGLNARAWTWFIFVGVWAGTVVMFCFAPIYAAFTSTYSYGNNHFLYQSIQFWTLGFLTCFLALLPRLLAKCFRQSYYPTDVDILRYVDKKNNDHDFTRDPAIPRAHADGAIYSDAAGRPSMTHHTFAPLVRAATSTSRIDGTREAAPTSGVQMHELHQTASRASSTHYDMLTGEQRPNRGYTFSSDEPRAGGLHKRKSVKDRLVPDVFKRSLKKNKDHRKRLTMINQEEDEVAEEPATSS